MATFLYAMGCFLLTITVGLLASPYFFVFKAHPSNDKILDGFLSAIGSAFLIGVGPYLFGPLGLFFLLAGYMVDREKKNQKKARDENLQKLDQ